jgi:dUTP pyrophosphatase
MRVLTDREIRERLRCTPPLVEGLVDPATQVQSCGIDLTALRVSRFTGGGAVDFDNSARVLSATEALAWEDGWLHLPAGPYHLIYGQRVNLPADVMALAYPRSSLLRCGVSVYTAVWDPGYSGRAEALLVVHNPAGFRLGIDARVAQLVFTMLGDAVAAPYSGRFKGENADA